MKYALYLVILTCVACGGSVSEAPPADAKIEKPKPPDESRRFPRDGQTKMELVDDNLLGKDYLPGGNLATYEKGGKSYQLFLIVTKDPNAAGNLTYDAKEKLTDPKFVASFGGYFGMDGETPWFIFPKTNHLLGIVGLSQEEADLVGRDFAARVQ